ncbi:hypothetical protein [Gordonia sp. (in: high G+C Gram-positive bacteria)]|uniref:hypothetical protein n=1 Tax=Gordonia sp. (in: high G+C Gram-positive bacteria) TaxID=84139 RepID=UPI00169F45F7|nr:hypothetical protein [Gordonia sp. (in: high G+C Gram-positive bacteria)]NLG46659.1 hypothetical protein [Gordonia sp. (in: high G+C Gram-positive bacteria)]
MTPSQVGIDVYTSFGAACIVAGGLVAAITGPLDLAKGSWLAAYLVLVCGVALIAIGAAQQHLPAPVSAPLQIVQLSGWTVANAAVIVGSLLGSTVTVNAGSVVLLVVLALTGWFGRALVNTRHVLAYAYLAILVVLVVSVPIGMVLGAR